MNHSLFCVYDKTVEASRGTGTMGETFSVAPWSFCSIHAARAAIVGVSKMRGRGISTFNALRMRATT
jgi:hypothetical protein